MKFIIILTIILLGAILHNKKFINLNVIVQAILCLIVIGVIVALDYTIFNLMPIANNNMVNLMIVFIFVILSITVILVTKNIILSAIRVIDYYIHKKKVFENGAIETGTIINIKRMDFRINYIVYYLIVNFNGKQIKSLCFLDNIYSIGENIDVIVYKNHNYVVLKN